MISDVPLGVMLSGGLDSSLITALMAEVSDRPGARPSRSASPRTAARTSCPTPQRVADRLGTDHHALVTSAADHPGLLDEALWHLEEPIADVSCLGFLLLSRLARETVTVALSGQGADELLGGYRKHEIAGAGALPCRPRAGGARRAGGAPGSSLARGITAASTNDPVARLLAMSRVVQPHDRAAAARARRFLQPGRRGTRSPTRCAAASRPQTRTPLRQTLHLDRASALVDNMLLYFDKISMATSLEVRVPFMDHDVVVFCSQLPDSRRCGVRRRKELLKRASRGLVEDAIIDKPKRGFFHSALGAWLGVHGDGLVRESCSATRRSRAAIPRDVVRALVASAGQDGKKADQRLFSLMLLERWQRMWTDPDSAGRRALPRRRRRGGLSRPAQPRAATVGTARSRDRRGSARAPRRARACIGGR